MTPCSVDDCQKPAAKGGLCWAHIKRKQRNKDAAVPMRGYGMPHEERLKRAATRYAAAEDDVEFERARKLLEKYSEGRAGRLRIQALVDRVVAIVMARIEGGQIRPAENVHPSGKNTSRG